MRHIVGLIAHLRILGVLALLGSLFLFASPAFALTTAGITINATPLYVSISNAPDGYGFGVIAVSTNYSTAVDYFTITNDSGTDIDITIGCNSTWDGGLGWTHDDSGTPGAATAALYATPATTAWNIVVQNAAPADLYTATAEASPKWGLRLMSPTSFPDGVLKVITVTLTATAS